MKKYLIIFTLLCSLVTLSAQIPQAPNTLLSPNAASLGLYGEIPISLFTGTPEISIPLHEFKYANFVFPISLSYHSSGIRPDQHPGWTGLGWNLNIGGVISRTVEDKPDDYTNKNLKKGNFGFYFNHNILNVSQWNSRDYLRKVAQSDTTYLYDVCPDKFNFNFLNYHGSFYLNEKGKWVVQCDKAIDVIFNGYFLPSPFNTDGTSFSGSTYHSTFNGFTIIAENGMKYIFGGNASSIEYSIDFFGQFSRQWDATSWYLTRIVLPNGENIDFKYERGNMINQMCISLSNLIKESSASSGFLKSDCSAYSWSDVGYGYEGQLISPVYLKDIEMPGCRVDIKRSISNELKYPLKTYVTKYWAWESSHIGNFLPILQQELSDSRNYLNELKWPKLDQIIIKDSISHCLRNYYFKYNNDSTRRLMLLSLYDSINGQSRNKYSFEYNNPEKLPDYLSNMTDHWGFYNGVFASVDKLHPDQYFLDKTTNPDCLQYGLLKKMTYPTGGYTRFVFEAHNYKKQLNKDRSSCITMDQQAVAGGVRIKQIINSSTGEEKDEKVDKEYFYINDYSTKMNGTGTSSGVLGGQSQYRFSYIVYAYNDKNSRKMFDIFNTQSVLPVSDNSCGNHIGYTEVVEKRPDKSFTKYQFTNFDNGHMDEKHDAIIQETETPYQPYSSKEQERGNLILQEDYDSTGTIQKRTNISYEKDDSTATNYVRAMKAASYAICYGSAVCYDEGTSFRFYTYNYRKLQETECLFKSGVPITSVVTQYTYNKYKLIKQLTTKTATRTEKTVFTYPDESEEGPARSMAANHWYSYPILECKYFKTDIGTEKQIECIRYLYDSHFLYDSQCNVCAVFFVPDYIFTIAEDKSSIKECYGYDYDIKGNIKDIIDNSKETVYIWGYNYRNLVCVVQNASIDDVTKIIGNMDDFEKKATPDFTKLDWLWQHIGSTSSVTRYTYNPLQGVSSIIDPRGVTTYYEYDIWGRLTSIKNQIGHPFQTFFYNYKK
jgi:YD repeat-containing protein